MIFKIFSPKNFAKKLAFLTQNKAKFLKKLIITLVFKKNANFFAENWGKSQKIVIITSTPGQNWTHNDLLHVNCKLLKGTENGPCHRSVPKYSFYIFYTRISDALQIPPCSRNGRRNQGCQIFSVQHTKSRKMHQIAINHLATLVTKSVRWVAKQGDQIVRFFYHIGQLFTSQLV
jgi:hypothetical protein